MKIYLVDGTYELFRSHFGAPPRKPADGREVGATLGLLRSLLMLLTTPGITHVACAVDHVIESLRNGLYAGYKTGAGLDPNLLAHLPLAEETVATFRLVVGPVVEVRKPATPVLANYAPLEAIPADPHAWGLSASRAVRLAESLAQHRAEALLFRTLATLREDVPLQETLADLEWQGADARLKEVC